MSKSTVKVPTSRECTGGKGDGDLTPGSVSAAERALLPVISRWLVRGEGGVHLCGPEFRLENAVDILSRGLLRWLGNGERVLPCLLSSLCRRPVRQWIRCDI